MNKYMFLAKKDVNLLSFGICRRNVWSGTSGKGSPFTPLIFQVISVNIRMQVIYIQVPIIKKKLISNKLYLWGWKIPSGWENGII